MIRARAIQLPLPAGWGWHPHYAPVFAPPRPIHEDQVLAECTDPALRHLSATHLANDICARFGCHRSTGYRLARKIKDGAHGQTARQQQGRAAT